MPLLMAEADRDVFRRESAALEREKEIMKDVPGWEVSFSSRGRCSVAWACLVGGAPLRPRPWLDRANSRFS